MVHVHHHMYIWLKGIKDVKKGIKSYKVYAEVHTMIINNNGFLSDFVEITSCVDAKTIILFHRGE